MPWQLTCDKWEMAEVARLVNIDRNSYGARFLVARRSPLAAKAEGPSPVTCHPSLAAGRHHLSPVTEILVIRLSSIGDIVNTLPAVAALRALFPQAGITWTIEKRYAVLIAGNPSVDRTIELDTLGWRRRPASGDTLRAIGRGLAELRRGRFDLAIDFQGLIKSALIARWSGAPARLGLAESWLKEPLAAAFYTERASAQDCHHVIEENLALVERVADHLENPAATEAIRGLEPDYWQFPLPDRTEDDLRVEQRLTGIEEFIVINPGGGWISKRWSPENYGELIRRLDAKTRWHFLLTGSPAEEPVIDRILKRSPSTRARLFRSSLVEFIALVRRARLFIGGDTGPLHLAAAAGTPIVAIYGPTDPARNGPFRPADIALYNRGPIDHSRRAANATFLSGITVDAVFDAVCERVRRQRA